MFKKIVSAILAVSLAAAAVPVCAYADWDEVNGNKVYISDDNGERLKGFQTVSGKKYYFDSDGYMVTGWTKIKGKKYYFDSNGVMKTGWLTLKNGKKYYLDDSGFMLTGFQTISGSKYYFSKDGVMKTGWLETSSGNKYYFKKDGKMAKNCTLKINDKSYTFDENGKAKLKTDSSNKKNTTPKDYTFPDFGTKKSKVLKECGIANYEYQSSTDSYFGDVIFGGIKSKIFMKFDDNDEFCTFCVFVPCSYSEYSAVRNSLRETLGTDYHYEDGEYIWIFDSVSVLLDYDFDTGRMSLMETSL